MNVQTHASVLRRKVAPSARTPEPVAPAATGPAQGIGRTFARAVSITAHLVAEQGATQRSVVNQSELLDSIDADAFVCLLTAGRAGPALAFLDQSGFSTVIEAMTIGRLGPRVPVPRRPTPTDASLLAELLDLTLEGLTDIVSDLRFDRAIPDLRLLSVLLEDANFDMISHDVTLVSGEERRLARVMLAVPQTTASTPSSTEGGDIYDQAVSGWSMALEASVMRSPASLRAELGRMTMPLSKVLALGVGSALTLPLSNLEEVQLVALDGTVQATGRLGQSRGMRAIRLTSWPNGVPPEPKMTEREPTKLTQCEPPTDSEG